MSKRSVDLFDDAPWPTDLPADQPTVYSYRPLLVFSLALVVLLMSSMALPWFASYETPSWTPFSHWLNLGWSPGTRNWGFLVFALGFVVVVVTGTATLSPRPTLLWLALLLATALVVVTLLEDFADLSVDPGPNLHADFGAWIGGTAAALGWIGIGFATVLARRRPPPVLHGMG